MSDFQQSFDPATFAPMENGTLSGGFYAGVVPAGAVRDWNHVENTKVGFGKYLLSGNYPNGPSAYGYFYVQNMTYFTTGNITQLATPYSASSSFIVSNAQYYRCRINDIWSAWRRVLTDQDTGPDYEAYLENWTQATATTFVHGLGAIPSLVTVMWVCKIANNGWLVGDECPAHYGSGSNYGISVGRSASSLTVGIRGTNAMNAAGTASFNLSVSTNWGVKVRAWK